MKRLREAATVETDDERDERAILAARRARDERLAARVAERVIAALRPSVEPFGMLTIDECCRFLHVSRPTLAAWEREGLLAPFRAGRVVLYDTRALDAFVRAHQAPRPIDELVEDDAA